MHARSAVGHLPEELRPGSQRLMQLALQYGLRLVVLFGSRARGRPHPASDYDLAVAGLVRAGLRRRGLTAEEARAFRSLHAQLQHVLRTSRVDLVLLELAPPLLAHRVARDGIPLFEAEDGEFARFCVRAVQRMEDARPLLQAQRRYLEARFGQPVQPSPKL